MCRTVFGQKSHSDLVLQKVSTSTLIRLQADVQMGDGVGIATFSLVNRYIRN